MNDKSKSVAERAYELWIARGQPHGSAEEDWSNAERERQTLKQPGSAPAGLDESLAESFPASDPPATHVADRPPSNAEDKWRAAARRTDKTVE
jgi:hypothetical protein